MPRALAWTGRRVIAEGARRMRITPALALPIAVTLASLVTGVVAAPATHIAELRVAAESAAQGPVDGGGPVDLTLPWEQPVLPASTSPLGPPTGDVPQSPLGADGSTPSTSGDVTVVPAVVVTGSAAGIPANVLVAYQRAAQSIAVTDPACHLQWPVLAGIGKVESGHARGGALDASGRTLSPILGPVLSGGPGLAAIPDTDGGVWDGDTVWDRAVGPMQFIPSSWRAHAVDGNGDGNADPSNVFDATLAAADYLCTGGRDLSRTADLRQAVFGYNHSWPYVDTVLAWAQAYASGGGLATAPVSGNGGTVVLASGRGNGGGSSGGHPSPRPSPSASATPTPTASATSTPTPLPAPSVTATAEPTPTVSLEPSTSSSPTAEPTPTPTPTPTDPSATPSPTGSPTPTDPCATPSPSPTVTDTGTPSPTPTP